MGKILDKVLSEMRDYSEMGLPTGETGMGMGDVPPDMRRHAGMGDKVKKAYRMNDILRHRGRAEEEEVSQYDDQYDDYDNQSIDIEELKSFFKENPYPSDEEVIAFAEEHGIDMEEMRQAVYALIQELLGGDEEYDSEPDFDEDDYGSSDEYSDDEFSFDVSSDTGERPARNENPRYRSEEREMMMRRRKMRRRW